MDAARLPTQASALFPYLHRALAFLFSPARGLPRL
jgi:hypothetical protein